MVSWDFITHDIAVLLCVNTLYSIRTSMKPADAASSEHSPIAKRLAVYDECILCDQILLLKTKN